MAQIHGDIVQEVVYRSYLEVFGTEGLVRLMVRRGLTLISARRTAALMKRYWDKEDSGQMRPGRLNFGPMLDELIFKPAAMEPTGDYSYANYYPFVAGKRCLDAILDAEPAFVELYKKRGRPVYEVFDYLFGIPLGVTVFVAVVDNFWSAYIGETDTPIPDVCG